MYSRRLFLFTLWAIKAKQSRPPITCVAKAKHSNRDAHKILLCSGDRQRFRRTCSNSPTENGVFHGRRLVAVQSYSRVVARARHASLSLDPARMKAQAVRAKCITLQPPRTSAFSHPSDRHPCAPLTARLALGAKVASSVSLTGSTEPGAVDNLPNSVPKGESTNTRKIAKKDPKGRKRGE